MSDGGKGSSPRPFSVDRQTFDSNWDNIFKKAISVEVTPEEDEAWKTLEEKIKNVPPANG